MPLSADLPGTWQLVSRIDLSRSGEPVEEPSLGSDPVALLVYDRAGHFAAQFMKRDRSVSRSDEALASGPNNTRARGGYDAYFGTYTVAGDTVTQTLVGALSPADVGKVVTREMHVIDGVLVIRIAMTAADGVSVVRTLRWAREA